MSKIIIAVPRGRIISEIKKILLKTSFAPEKEMFDDKSRKLTFSSKRKDVDFIYGDIRDYKKLNPILKKFDAVIWLAALVGDGACAINPELTFQINSESVKFLAENFKKRIVLNKRQISFLKDYVFLTLKAMIVMVL